MRHRPWSSIPILAGLALCWVSSAQAALIASASIDGGGTIFAIDNDATSTCGSPVVGPCQLPDLDPVLGSLITAAHVTGGGDLSVGLAVQTQDIGPVNRLDSTGTQFTNDGAAAHTFSVAIGATDFQGPVTSATATGSGQWSTLSPGGDFGDSSITMRWFNDPENVQGALDPSAAQPGDLLATFTDLAGPGNPDSFSTGTLGPFAVNDPGLFSMTLQFDGTLDAGVRLTGREMTELKPVLASAPSTLLLVLGSVLGLLGWRRVRV
jgi:hypothetical protein